MTSPTARPYDAGSGGRGPRTRAGAMVRARGQAADTWRSALCGLMLTGPALLLDGESGGLTAARAALWTALGAAVFAVLLPLRVTAGDGWLTVRGPLHGQQVRTDALVSVERSGEIAVRLVLRDAYGGRLAIDPGLLVANPLLWHELDTGARRALRDGTLRQGAENLRAIGDRVDGDVALALLREAGLDRPA